MSDDRHAFAAPDLVGDAARDAAGRIHSMLVGRELIDVAPSYCALDRERQAFAPGPKVGEAVRVPVSQIYALAANGLEFSFEREVVAPWGEGYDGTLVRCRRCGRRVSADIDPGFQTTLEGLQSWLDGGALPTFSCSTCGHEDTFNELDLEPRWCAAEFVVNLWNWSILEPSFERLMLEMLTPASVLIFNRI